MSTKKTNTAKKTSGKKTTKPRTIKVVEETDDGRTVDVTPATDSKSKKSKAEPQDKKLSALDAAAKVLAESSEPLNTKQMVEAMAAKGYWTSPGGKTPHATLYTVVTMLPKTWQPGIDCSPETGCDRNMDRGGGRRNPLMFKGLRGALAIRSRCHGRHKNSENQAQEVAVASSSARVCRRSA